MKAIRVVALMQVSTQRTDSQPSCNQQKDSEVKCRVKASTDGSVDLRPSWVATSPLTAQEYLNILWNRHINSCVHMSPVFALVLSKIKPVYTIYSIFVRYILILSFRLHTEGNSRFFLAFWFSRPNSIWIPLLPKVCYMPCPSHSLHHSKCFLKRLMQHGFQLNLRWIWDLSLQRGVRHSTRLRPPRG